MKPELDKLIAGNRRTLAKAITLIESSLELHRAQAQQLLEEVLPYSGRSIRIGISGTPGVGKSTFIEVLGKYLLSQGRRLAVLAVDPSSPIAGGSILGDKTRMEALSREADAFIRPSPSSGQLGGVAQKTRESILLCEASGFDVVIVETVGVGQSEFEVAGMVDFFLVLMQPNGGDDLQGIKKGILELADALVINKADGDGKRFADQAKRHYENALTLMKHHAYWRTRVLTCSARENIGVDAIWAMVCEFETITRDNGAMSNKRAEQNGAWMETLFDQLLELKLLAKPSFKMQRLALEQAVMQGETTAIAAAKQLIELL